MVLIFENNLFGGLVSLKKAKVVFRSYICSIEFMTSVRPSIGLFAPYFVAIFQPRVFKVWNLIELYLRTNSTAWICDPLARSSGINLGLGHSHIRIFLEYFIHF
jgi:hypothetical protein